MKDITAVIPLPKEGNAEVLNCLKDRNMVLLVERGDNPSANRNRGIKKSRTNFIAFFNGHSSIRPDWIKKSLKFMKNHPEIDIVGGPQHNSSEETVFGRASGYAMSSIFGAGGIWRRYSGNKTILDADETMLTSSNLLCRRSVFKKIKFDESIYPGEDPKFISDAKKAGFKVAFFPEIVVYNRRRTNLSSLAKQIFLYAYSRTKKESLFDTLKRPFFLIPSIFIIYLISLLFFNPIWYAVPALLYLSSLILFTFYLSMKNIDVMGIFLLPLIFPAIHISYGIGFIYGTILNAGRTR